MLYGVRERCDVNIFKLTASAQSICRKVYKGLIVMKMWKIKSAMARSPHRRIYHCLWGSIIDYFENDAEGAKWAPPNSSRPQQLRTMASEIIDKINWSLPSSLTGWWCQSVNTRGGRYASQFCNVSTEFEPVVSKTNLKSTNRELAMHCTAWDVMRRAQIL